MRAATYMKKRCDLMRGILVDTVCCFKRHPHLRNQLYLLGAMLILTGIVGILK
ncbi:hypothetical protein D3C77_800860 [compost metagenome]